MSVGVHKKRISEEGRLNLDNVTEATYDIWKKLVTAGKTTVIQGSLVDDAIIETIINLPEYNTSTNLVYLSNIADHIVRPKTWAGCDQYLDPYLQSLDSYNPKEHPAIFLDTLRGYNYWLRVSKGAPVIYPADLLASRIFDRNPIGFQPPHLHYERQPKKFTPLDIFSVDGHTLELSHVLEDVYRFYPNIDKSWLEQMIKDLTSLIYYDGNVDLKYFGGLKPIDWVRYRFGEIIGQATAISLEEKKKAKPKVVE